jgi:hypothetical protein
MVLLHKLDDAWRTFERESSSLFLDLESGSSTYIGSWLLRGLEAITRLPI